MKIRLLGSVVALALLLGIWGGFGGAAEASNVGISTAPEVESLVSCPTSSSVITPVKGGYVAVITYAFGAGHYEVITATYLTGHAPTVTVTFATCP